MDFVDDVVTVSQASIIVYYTNCTQIFLRTYICHMYSLTNLLPIHINMQCKETQVLTIRNIITIMEAPELFMQLESHLLDGLTYYNCC